MKNTDGKRVTDQYQQPMNVEEVQGLKNQLKTTEYAFILVSICLCGCIVFYVPPFSLTQILLLILLVACTYWLLASNPYENHPIKQDLEAGIKLVVQGKIEAKREYSSDKQYFLTILGHEFEVSSDQCQPVKVNQAIEIHFAPKSKYVFQVIPLYSPINE